ncbi:unnamed protein product [Vicia faba]|uniref:Brix domain-containing protein n=1 Tax=Vicia faba TaxID=3906 RepID=A0AAV0ZZQ6_VICFA|nr:unnamed protein product [Vicia faba]
MQENGGCGEKRKRGGEKGEAAAVTKKDEVAPERPVRTLLGWKNKPENENENEIEVKDNGSSPIFRNKEKVLVTCSRRIVFRYRHLILSSSKTVPLECRKAKDLYLWMSKCLNGPSVKILVSAVPTMEELNLTGNHLKGSRPLLTFSSNFEKDAHWKLLKEMLLQIFETPKDHRKAKPFHDHVFVFSIVDDHIWFRNYQISVPHNESDKLPRGGLDKMTLIEFWRSTLYVNPFYVSPNQIRALQKKKKAGTFAKKVKAKTRRKRHEMANPLEPDEFADMWKD